jgi:hypothetical protein
MPAKGNTFVRVSLTALRQYSFRELVEAEAAEIRRKLAEIVDKWQTEKIYHSREILEDRHIAFSKEPRMAKRRTTRLSNVKMRSKGHSAACLPDARQKLEFSNQALV